MSRRWWIIGIGAIVGAGLGFLYYWEVGCVSGTCAITSSPYMSTLWGGLMGGLAVDIVHDALKKKNTTTEGRS